MGACLLLACGACAPADKKGEEMEQPKITPLTERQNVSRALGGTDALGREIYQAITFLDRDNEHLLLDRAPHLKTTRWHPHFLDVIPPTGGKDKGMDAILEHFGIPVEESMAFGDGENDLSMLVHAGIGVAMGTASDEVKRQADWATASVDEDGIVKALQHFQVL